MRCVLGRGADLLPEQVVICNPLYTTPTSQRPNRITQLGFLEFCIQRKAYLHNSMLPPNSIEVLKLLPQLESRKAFASSKLY